MLRGRADEGLLRTERHLIANRCETHRFSCSPSTVVFRPQAGSFASHPFGVVCLCNETSSPGCYKFFHPCPGTTVSCTSVLPHGVLWKCQAASNGIDSGSRGVKAGSTVALPGHRNDGTFCLHDPADRSRWAVNRYRPTAHLPRDRSRPSRQFGDVRIERRDDRPGGRQVQPTNGTRLARSRLLCMAQSAPAGGVEASMSKNGSRVLDHHRAGARCNRCRRVRSSWAAETGLRGF